MRTHYCNLYSFQKLGTLIFRSKYMQGKFILLWSTGKGFPHFLVKAPFRSLRDSKVGSWDLGVLGESWISMMMGVGKEWEGDLDSISFSLLVGNSVKCGDIISFLVEFLLSWIWRWPQEAEHSFLFEISSFFLSFFPFEMTWSSGFTRFESGRG